MIKGPIWDISQNKMVSASSSSAFGEGIPDDYGAQSRPSADTAEHDTSIAVADAIVASRSAETIGVPRDQSRPSRARATRVGTPLMARRDGAGTGAGANRHAGSSALRGRGSSSAGNSAHCGAASQKNGNSRKSNSCTAQLERLRLDYKFEKPSCSAGVFPSMYEELLRSFEEDEVAEESVTAYHDQELALLMSEVFSDDDDKESPIPENLLYRIFAEGSHRTQPGLQPTQSGLEKYSPSTAASRSPACSKTDESYKTSATNFSNVTDAPHLMRPQPPSPPEDSANPSDSDISLPPSASVTAHAPFRPDEKVVMKQTEPSGGAGRAMVAVMKDSKLSCLSSADTSEVCAVENKEKDEGRSRNTFVSSHPVLTQMQEAAFRPSEQVIPGKDSKVTRLPDHPVCENVLSFGILAEAYKEPEETIFCDENISGFSDGMLTERTIHSKYSPPSASIPNNDRIRSDKRIPLPEEMLVAINRAIQLGKLTAVGASAQGDSDTPKTCTKERTANEIGQLNSLGTRDQFPPKSSKFPLVKKEPASSLEPFSYFKLSSCKTMLCKVKKLSDASIENASHMLPGIKPENSVYPELDRSERLILKSNTRGGPLYKKNLGATENEKFTSKGTAIGFETPLSTPPNSPIRSKAGITFSDPVATCVTDCNTNMAVSGGAEDAIHSTKNKERHSGDGGPSRAKQDKPGDVQEGKRATLISCSSTGAAGDEADIAGKERVNSSSAKATITGPKDKSSQNAKLKTSLNSHPSILLQPRGYLDFYTFLKSKKLVTKEVRKPKTKIFKLQRMMTDANGDTGSLPSLSDRQESEINTKPVFPRGREIPPGWKPGQHGSHPITRISAEYEMAAQNSMKSKRHVWKKTKLRRRVPPSKVKAHPLKKSASETSVTNSPRTEEQKTSRQPRQESSDDATLLANSNFERKRQFYEHQQRSKAAPGNGGGRLSKRSKQKRVTEQVKFLQTIDDICTAEDEADSEDEDHLALPPRYNDKKNYIASSLAKYYSDLLPSFGPVYEPAERNSSGTNLLGVRIARTSLHVPSTISLDRLRAIQPPSPQSTGWLSRSHHSNPNLPTSSAKWPDSPSDAAQIQIFRKHPKKSYRATTDWISPSKAGVNSDYRQAWDQLRANYVEVKSSNQPVSGDVHNESVKKEAREDGKTGHGKAEKNVSQKKAGSKQVSNAKEKSANFKLKQVSRLPAPPARSEEDTWCYSVNAMLLKAKQVMADSQEHKKGTHRFPRHNSAAVVSPVIEQKATSSFLKTLLKQDAEEVRRNKAMSLANNEGGIKQQRDRIRNTVGSSIARKNFSPGRTANNSCNASCVSSTENCLFSKSPDSVDENVKRPQRQVAEKSTTSMPKGSSSYYTALRIHKPLGLNQQGNRHSWKNERSPPKETVRQKTSGSNYILDQTLHYFDYPYITDNSIVPMYGDTNTNASSGDQYKADTKRNRVQGVRRVVGKDVFFIAREFQKLRNTTQIDDPYVKALWSKNDRGKSIIPQMNFVQSKMEYPYFSTNNNATKSRRTELLGRQLLNSPAVKRTFGLSSFNTCQNKSSPLPKNYGYENLNQGVLLECLLGIGLKTNSSKQFGVSGKSRTVVNLATAKAKADAAYEAFLTQSELTESREVENANGESVEGDGLHETPDDSYSKDNSSVENLSLSTKTCNREKINTCSEINSLFDNDVDRKCSMGTKNGRKNFIKHGRFPFGYHACARPASPLFVCAQKKKLEFSKKVWRTRQNPCIQDHFRRLDTARSCTHSSFTMEKEFLNSKRSGRTRLTNMLSSQTYQKTANDTDSNCYLRSAKHHFMNQKNRCPLGNELKNSRLASLGNEANVGSKQASGSLTTSKESKHGRKTANQKKIAENVLEQGMASSHEIPSSFLGMMTRKYNARTEFLATDDHEPFDDKDENGSTSTGINNWGHGRYRSPMLSSELFPNVPLHEERTGGSKEGLTLICNEDIDDNGEAKFSEESNVSICKAELVEDYLNQDEHSSPDKKISNRGSKEALNFIGNENTNDNDEGKWREESTVGSFKSALVEGAPIKDEYASPGPQIANGAKMSPLSPTTNNCSLSCERSGFSESDGDCVEENEKDSHQDCKGTDKSPDTNNIVENSAYQLEDSIVFDQIYAPKSEEGEGERCESFKGFDILDESRDFSNDVDPDYQHISGYDLCNRYSASSLEANGNHQPKEQLQGSIYSMTSSMTSVTLPPITGDNSERSTPSLSEMQSKLSRKLSRKDSASSGEAKYTSRISLLHNDECASPSELSVNGTDRQMSKPSCPSALSHRDYALSPTPSKAGCSSVISVKSHSPPKVSTPTGDSPQKCQNLFPDQPLDNAPATAGKEEIQSPVFKIDSVRSRAANAVDNPREDVDSIGPPPPTPDERKLGLTCNRDYLKTNQADTFVWRTEKLLSGLNAVATTCAYMPAVRLDDWHLARASATVLKVFYCSQETARPHQDCFDKGSCQLSKATAYTVFYRQDNKGIPAW